MLTRFGSLKTIAELIMESFELTHEIIDVACFQIKLGDRVQILRFPTFGQHGLPPFAGLFRNVDETGVEGKQ